MAWIMAGLVVVIAGWVAWSFNRLVALRNRLRAAWGNVDVLLKRRADLVPNLVQTVRGYMGYEEGTLTRVTAARTNAMRTRGAPENTTDRARAENELTSGM
ncbi:MAG: LemA family protein, partial [Gemmatimonadales bacterium]